MSRTDEIRTICAELDATLVECRAYLADPLASDAAKEYALKQIATIETFLRQSWLRAS